MVRRIVMARRRVVKYAAAGATTVVLGIGAGAAYAYFTSTGSGTGSGTVANGDQNITIATNATAGSSLQPGGTGDLIITATNRNPVAVQITSFSISSVTGCTTPSITLTSPSNSYLPVTIAANASATRIVIAGALTMSVGASNDCQGKTLTVNLSSVTVSQ